MEGAEGMEAMTTQQKALMFRNYAELLRRAWLNPSCKKWQNDVYKFERENRDELDFYQVEWQDAARRDDEANNERKAS